MATVPFNYAPASATGSGATINVAIAGWECTVETPLAVEVVSLVTGEMVGGASYVRNVGGGGVVTSVDVANTTGGAANAYVRRVVEPAQEWSPRSESGANLRTLEGSLNAMAKGVQQVYAEVFGSEDPEWSGGVVRAADGFRIAPIEVRKGKLLRFDESGAPTYDETFTDEMVEELAALDALGAGVVKKTSSDPAAYAALASSASGEAMLAAGDYAAMRSLLGLVPGADVQAFDGDLAAIAALDATGFARRTGSNAWTLASGEDIGAFLDLGTLAYEDAAALGVSIVPATSEAVSLGSPTKFFGDIRGVDVWAGELHTANGMLMGDGNIQLLNGDVPHNDGVLVLNMEAGGAPSEFVRLVAADGSEPNKVLFTGLPSVVGIGTAFAVNFHAATAMKLNGGGVETVGGTINHGDDIFAVYLKGEGGSSFEFARMLAGHGAVPNTMSFGLLTNLEGVGNAQVESVSVGDGGSIVNVAAGGIGVTSVLVLPSGIGSLGAGIDEPTLNFGGSIGTGKRGIWHDTATGALKVRCGLSDAVAIDGDSIDAAVPLVGMADGSSIEFGGGGGTGTIRGSAISLDAATVHVAGSFVFEGATSDSSETTLAAADPTADRTITLPDASGTVAVFGALPAADNGLMVANGTTGLVEAAGLITLDLATNTFAAASGSGASGGRAIILAAGDSGEVSGDGGHLFLIGGSTHGSSGFGGSISFTTGAGVTKDGSVVFNLNQTITEAGNFSISGAHDLVVEATNSATLYASPTVHGIISCMGAVTGMRSVAASGSSAITQSTTDMRGQLHVASGQAAQQVRTLPSASAGLTATFANMDSDGLRIVAASGDNIRFGGIVSAAAGHAETSSVGAVISLEAIDSTTWLVTSAVESWTIQT